MNTIRPHDRWSLFTWLSPLVLLAGALLLVPAAMADSPARNSIERVDVSTLPGNRLEFRIELTEAIERPRSFTIRDPARIAVDFPGTRNATGEREISIDTGVARSINFAETDDRTRMVFNLSELPRYETRVDGNAVIVTLGEQRRPTAAAEEAEPEAAPEVTAAAAETADEPFVGDDSAAPSPAHRRVDNVDFRRGRDGEGRILIDLSDPDIPVSIDRDGRDVVVDLSDTTIPEELRERLDVLDFATPVQFVDIMQRGGDGRITIKPRDAEYEQLAYQSDERIVIELKPLTPDEVAEREREEPEYEGERLSLNFQDIEVRSVLQLLADFTDLNIVVTDSVSGNVTLRLRNVPWDQALDIILQTRGLDKRQSGNVIFVAPFDEIAERERQRRETEEEMQERAPLRTEYVQVNYARAGDLASLIDSGEASLLSERARVSVDERTNTLVIQDTERHLEEARRMINRLDIPVRQVLIESRIVVATDDFNREIGARFGVTRDTTARGTQDGFATSGDTDATTQILNNETIGDGRYNVNLPVSNPSGSMALALARLPLGTLLELELSAMQAEGRGEIISSPRVITANQREATIEQGVEIPYQEAAASGATSVSFRSATLSLNVTPQITPDDRIIMDLRVTRDTVGEIFAGVPSIDTRAVETQVLVDDGETVVLGGIYEQETSDQVERVPFFGDLPIVGRLFRNEFTQDDKSELLVFVTPQIVRGIDDM
jgi:type IV pilus assembly protein PilQ